MSWARLSIKRNFKSFSNAKFNILIIWFTDIEFTYWGTIYVILSNSSQTWFILETYLWRFRKFINFNFLHQRRVVPACSRKFAFENKRFGSRKRILNLRLMDKLIWSRSRLTLMRFILNLFWKICNSSMNIFLTKWIVNILNK